MVYKVSTMRVKQGIKQQHQQEAKNSAIKEIRNLVVENKYVGEISYKTLTQELKDKALLILMFMVLNHNRLLKTCGVADGSVQR